MQLDMMRHTVLWAVGGSRCYGMHTESSDVDTKGVAVAPASHYHGFLERFEQVEGPSHLEQLAHLLTPEESRVAAATKLEGVVYEMTKFIGLAASSNPNILDVLFCRDEEVRLCTPIGQALRDNRDMFVSAAAKHTFSGYSASQLKRIEGHRKWLLDPPTHQPTRDEYGLPERTVIPADQLMAAEAEIQKRMDQWEVDYGNLSDGERIFIQGQVVRYLAEMQLNLDDRWKAVARSIGYDENFLLLLDKERRYKAAKQQWEQYNRWKKERNPARAELEAKWGYDTKHAAHLVRLLRMAREILLTGNVNVWRGDRDRDELLAIRRGEWKYDDLLSWAQNEDRELSDLYAAKKYIIPKAPDRVKINALCCELVERHLSGGS